MGQDLRKHLHVHGAQRCSPLPFTELFADAYAPVLHATPLLSSVYGDWISTHQYQNARVTHNKGPEVRVEQATCRVGSGIRNSGFRWESDPDQGQVGSGSGPQMLQQIQERATVRGQWGTLTEAQ